MLIKLIYSREGAEDWGFGAVVGKLYGLTRGSWECLPEYGIENKWAPWRKRRITKNHRVWRHAIAPLISIKTYSFQQNIECKFKWYFKNAVKFDALISKVGSEFS